MTRGWRGHLWQIVPYAAFACALAAGLVAAIRGERFSPSYNAMFAVPQFVGLIYCLRVSFDRTGSRSARRPWTLIAVFFACSIVFGVTYGTLFQGPDVSVAAQFWAQTVNRLGTTPVLIAAFLAFARQPMTRAERLRLVSDGVVLAGGGFMVIWYFYLSDPLVDGPTVLRVSALAFPLLDMMVLLAVCNTLIRGVPVEGRRALTILLAGAVGIFVSDVWIVYRSSHIAGWAPEGPTLMMSASFFMLLAAGAVERTRHRAGRAAAARLRPSRHMRWLPHLALSVGFTLLLIAATVSDSVTMIGLVSGSMAMVAGVMARQLSALRENEFLLTRDSLTGLANRDELARSLQESLERAGRTGHRVGVMLIDLNGFKQVNDTHGHAAGDQVLVAFSEVLRENVRPGDTPARLGGDEFAVVIDQLDDERAATAIADRIVAAAAGRRIADDLPPGIRASIGICLSEPLDRDDADTAGETAEILLRRADAAMYTAKRTGGDGWSLAG